MGKKLEKHISNTEFNFKLFERANKTNYQKILPIHKIPPDFQQMVIIENNLRN